MKDKSTIKTIKFKNSFIKEINDKAELENRSFSNMVKTLIIRGLKS